MMICKFLKFLLLNTFKKKIVFQIDTGRVIKKRNEGSMIIWSIKDPFIKQINYGVEIQKEQVKIMLGSMMRMLQLVSKCRVAEWFKKENKQQSSPSDESHSTKKRVKEPENTNILTDAEFQALAGSNVRLSSKGLLIHPEEQVEDLLLRQIVEHLVDLDMQDSHTGSGSNSAKKSSEKSQDDETIQIIT